MTTDNFCFYLQNRVIQTSQTGGQRYSDTSPVSIPWLECSSLTSFLQPRLHESNQYSKLSCSTPVSGDNFIYLFIIADAGGNNLESNQPSLWLNVCHCQLLG
jgi:hypothetical protein